jgi:hypothetical protein
MNLHRTGDPGSNKRGPTRGGAYRATSDICSDHVHALLSVRKVLRRGSYGCDLFDFEHSARYPNLMSDAAAGMKAKPQEHLDGTLHLLGIRSENFEDA